MNSTLQWFGQAFIKIVTPSGKTIFIDPWKDFPPGNNLFPKGITLESPDVIVVTHGHLDHLGDTVDIAKKEGSKDTLKILSIFEVMIYLMSQGVPGAVLQGMNKGGSVTIDGTTFTMVNAIHSAGIGAFAPKELVSGGEAAGFILRLENGMTIYHAGDTDVFSDMKLIADRYHPDIALLPIGGVYTMDPEGAAYATELLHPRVVIPIHYAGSFQLPGTPDVFKDEVKKRKLDVVVTVLNPGELYALNESKSSL